MKRLFISTALILAFVLVSPPADAASGIGSLVSTSLLGTSIGLLIGATTMAFMSNPGDHGDRVAYSAGIGFLCGFSLGLYGIISPTYESSRSPSGSHEHVYGIRMSIPLE